MEPNFGKIDPSVSAAEEAARNSDRSETHAIAEKLVALCDAPPDFRDFDEIYRTDPITLLSDG